MLRSLNILTLHLSFPGLDDRIPPIPLHHVLPHMDQLSKDQQIQEGHQIPSKVALPTRPPIGVERFWLLH